jgi:phytoene synthase
VPAPADLSLEATYRAAAAATAAGSKSFYFATRFFPPDLARAAHAVYWFCRTTDDLVDEAPSREQGGTALAAWEQQVRAGFAGEAPANPVLRAFFDAVNRHGIAREDALELIEGVRMDLHRTRYATFDELRVFCYRVASTVGLMMAKVIGLRDPSLEAAARPRAIDLGIAMQLTNILRDVGTDLVMDRIYLPADEIARFGYDEERLRAGVRDAAFRALMEFQIARAHRYYAAAEPGVAMLNPRGSFAVKVASDVYRRILDVIERNDYDVFARRAVVPAAQKYWMTARTMAVPMARHWARTAFGRA